METVNNSKVAIQRQGKFNGLNSVLRDSDTNSLISASQLTREKNAVVIITVKDKKIPLDWKLMKIILSKKINHY